MSLLTERTTQELAALGFIESQFGMRLVIGSLTINATEGPFGIPIIFTEVSRRTATQYDVTAPYPCNREQVARLIFANVRLNFRDCVAALTSHFDQRGIVGYQ